MADLHIDHDSAAEEPFKRFMDPRLGLDGLLRGHTADLLVNGARAFPAMLHAIASARRSIDMCMYIFRGDNIGWRFVHALADKARQGVSVRVTYDAIGCIDSGKDHFKFLKQSGARVRVWNPLIPKRIGRLWRPNSRDHRKILVIDEHTAFVGGMNIGDEYDGDAQDIHHWRDCIVKIRGPVATCLAAVARQTYLRRSIRSRPKPTPRIPGGQSFALVHAPRPFDPHRRIFHAYDSLIRNAKTSLWIISSYFVPGTPIIHSILNAARRGVDVRIILPGNTDLPVVRLASQRWYETLLSGGVKLFEIQNTVLHAKIAVADGLAGIVGSANIDNRSFHLNWEVLVTILGRQFNQQLSEQFLVDQRRSEQVSLPQWQARPAWRKLAERAAFALAPFW